MSARFVPLAVLLCVCGTGIALPNLHAQLGLVDNNTAHGLVDLKNKPGGREVNNILKSLAQGNEGSGGLNSLTYNTQTGEVRGEGFVRHRHTYGSNPLNGIGIGGKKVVAYDSEWKGSFSYNHKTRSGHATLDLGRGIKFDTRRIERALNGDLGALLENVPNLGITEKTLRNEYDAIKTDYERRYGPGNVYFASKRFVDWARPETAGEWVVRAVATGGVDTGRIMAEVKRESLKELQQLIQWMQAKGMREAGSIAQAILSGQQVSWPYLAVKWQTVGYFSQNKVAGQNVGPEIRSTHAAFVIIWQGNNGGSGGGSVMPNNNPGQNPGAMARNQFRYSSGTFVNQGNGRWVEYRDNSSSSQFVERGRTMDFVELYDALRQLSVRLSRHDATYSDSRSPGIWRRWPGSEGSWR